VKADRETTMTWMRPKTIAEPIADDWWGVRTADGGEWLVRLTVGRPEPIPGDPNGFWYCPLLIEGFSPEVRCIYGAGPVDALLNAMTQVRAFADSVGGEFRTGARSSSPGEEPE